MGVYIVHPLADPKWDERLLHHPRASVFHTSAWLSALHGTYAYEPVVFSTSAPGGSLENGLLFCNVRSWITGRRLVSLPFSDHCDPLIHSPAAQKEILAYVRAHINRERCRYAEIRPFATEESNRLAASNLQPSEKFFLHTLSLDPALDAIFRGLHKDCVQRKVRRAERETLVYERGGSESLLNRFYQLLLKTRRRHGLPPQPLKWFRHLISCMGDRLTIRVASKDDRPVAAILTLAFKDTVTYKYGCSDSNTNHLGGMPFLFWKTIQEAKEQGMRRLDLGRSELDNPGLVAFKDRLGARRMDLIYYRFTSDTASKQFLSTRRTHLLKRFVGQLPDALLIAAGRLLYRHIG